MTGGDSSTLSSRTAKPGECLRRIRTRLGLTTRKVAELTRRIALEQRSDDFSLSHARLVQIENEASMPSLQKLFSLSCVYGISVEKLFYIYLHLDSAERLHASMALPKTHLASFETAKKTIPFPAHLSATSPASETEVVNHITQAWGEVPAPLLEHLKVPQSRYGFIGLTDYTMHPLIRPGSVVQLQDCHRVAKPMRYRSEFDRPIYFLESRAGYICSWCETSGGRLFSIPHPLSSCRPQVFNSSQVDVIGRVTGVALRFSDGFAHLGPRNDEHTTLDVATAG